MKLLALASAVIVLGFAERADAQNVIGTYGTPGAPLGYYSPYPGTLYSPFRQPAPVPFTTYSMGNLNRYGGYPQNYSNGYTITRFPGPIGVPQHHNQSGFNSHGMHRR